MTMVNIVNVDIDWIIQVGDIQIKDQSGQFSIHPTGNYLLLEQFSFEIVT